MGNDITARTAIFKGLNRMPYIEDGELRSMKNLSSDAYPFLSTRKGREEYKIPVYVPGVPGDGYLMDVEELPEKNIEKYFGEIVKVTGVPPEEAYIPGEFYYYDGEKWVQGINNENFIGITDEVSGEFETSAFEREQYVYGYSNYRNKYENKIIKYVGNNYEGFEKGKTYQYKLKVEAYWQKIAGVPPYGAPDLGNIENIENIPKATEQYANERACFYWFSSDTGDYEYGEWYRCFLKGYGYWEECEDVYEPVKVLPETPAEGKLIRYLGNYSGQNIEKAYYTCCEETYNSGSVYYYEKKEAASGEYISDTLPEASAENLGKTYLTGITTGMYYICEWDGEKYDWKETERPQVAKSVTIKEYLKEYLGSELDSIIEIGQLLGKIAVLYKTKDGKFKLFYEKEIFEVTDVSDIPGKKLQTVGSKIIVGEGGSYLYRDKETNKITLHPGNVKFSRTINAGYVEYAPDKYKDSYIKADGSGNIEFICYAPSGEGTGYEEVYEGLKNVGTDFRAEFDGNVYYLKSAEGCSYEPNKEVGGYFDGSITRKQYADVLTIRATGVEQEYYWSDEKGKGMQITFASTTSFLPDVVAWKKRLWGYTDNYIQGTAQDIFGEGNNIDWTTGDNTYTEPISQPIWQGGNITGLAALREALIIFKTDNITIFTGNYPAIMQGSTISCRGLVASDRESVAVANEYVYYMASDGVYRFGGGAPYNISNSAKIKGTEAVGASNGNKYWLSIKEDDGEYSLYVFDINLGIWHKEDNVAAVSFTMLGSKMYMATASQIFCLDAMPENVEWEAELWYDEGTFNYKKYKGFEVRGDLGECEVYLKADDGEWKLYTFTEGKLSIKSEPFWCRELGIKLKGRGICELKSLDRTYEVVDR
jgi:hypothetical protein